MTKKIAIVVDSGSDVPQSVLDENKGTLIKLLNDGTVKKLFTTDSIYNGNHKKIEVVDL